jgi:hypothetical protein
LQRGQHAWAGHEPAHVLVWIRTRNLGGASSPRGVRIRVGEPARRVTCVASPASGSGSPRTASRGSPVARPGRGRLCTASRSLLSALRVGGLLNCGPRRQSLLRSCLAARFIHLSAATPANVLGRTSTGSHVERRGQLCGCDPDLHLTDPFLRSPMRDHVIFAEYAAPSLTFPGPTLHGARGRAP